MSLIFPSFFVRPFAILPVIVQHVVFPQVQILFVKSVYSTLLLFSIPGQDSSLCLCLSGSGPVLQFVCLVFCLSSSSVSAGVADQSSASPGLQRQHT